MVASRVLSMRGLVLARVAILMLETPRRLSPRLSKPETWALLLGTLLLGTTGRTTPLRVQTSSAFSQLRFREASPTQAPRQPAPTQNGGARWQLSGVLTDDVKQGISDALVSLELPASQRAFPCAVRQRVSWRKAGPDRGRAETRTLPGGAFCFAFADVPNGAPQGDLLFEGDELHAASRLTVDLRPVLGALELAFEAAQYTFRLERETQRVRVLLEPGQPEPHPSSHVTVGLSLLDADQRRTALGSAHGMIGDAVSFDIPSTALGAPGSGILVAEHAGSEQTRPSRSSAPVQKTIEVRVVPAAPRLSGFPSDGVVVPVRVETQLGPVPHGWVELHVAEHIVGRAPVVAGLAEPVARFSAEGAQQARLSLHYVPREPFWLAGAPAAVLLEIDRPSRWRLWPWLLATSLVGYAVFRSWQRPRPNAAPAQRRASTAQQPSVVIQRRSSAAGLSGRVVDAHDGMPITGARIEVVLASFASENRAAATRSDLDGRFELGADSLRSYDGAELLVMAKWHASQRLPLPGPCELEIRLVSRRRQLLERLVGWAEQQGRPWRKERAPTPAEVARTAEKLQNPHIEQWAVAVEEAAFGNQPIDEDAEQRVRQLEPKL